MPFLCGKCILGDARLGKSSFLNLSLDEDVEVAHSNGGSIWLTPPKLEAEGNSITLIGPYTTDPLMASTPSE